MNAEIVLGTVQNAKEAVNWLGKYMRRYKVQFVVYLMLGYGSNDDVWSLMMVVMMVCGH